MPKIKPSAVSLTAGIVQRNIESRACTVFGVNTGKDVAKKIGMNESTFKDKKRKPRTWTLEQLIVTAQALKVPLSWLVTDHSGEIKEETA